LLRVSPSLAFDWVVHLATVVAVVVYFSREIFELMAAFLLGSLEALKLKRSQNFVFGQHFRVGWLIIIGTIPTALMGVLFKEQFESLFGSTLAVGCFLLVTAGLILLAEWLGKNKRDEFQIDFFDAIVIGFAQGCAIAPGLSRSGATVSASLLRGLKRDFAARFSFLLAVPAILGAGLVEAHKILAEISTGIGFGPLFLGFVTALISGWLAIKVFMQLIQRTSIRIFAYYCLVVGILVLVFLR
jgi:undecaprenyl-diphosphatase